MRVFNVRLAAILLSIVMVFGIGVFFLHGYQVRRNADFFLDEARKSQELAAEAVKDNDANAEKKANKEAINFLNLYIKLKPIQLKPEEVDVLEELGIMMADYSREGNLVQDWRMFRDAKDRLDRVVQLDPDRVKARRKLIDMYMLPQVRRYQDAKQHLTLLADLPKDAGLLEQLGECQAEMGEAKAAQASFQKAISLKASQLDAYVQLAELLRNRFQKPDEADSWMEKLVRVNPTSAKAHYLRGKYLIDPKVKQSDEGEVEALEALKLAPDDADVLILVASCSIVWPTASKCTRRTSSCTGY
jgi:tetratricopeptide (TPR) repeat protein